MEARLPDFGGRPFILGKGTIIGTRQQMLPILVLIRAVETGDVRRKEASGGLVSKVVALKDHGFSKEAMSRLSQWECQH